MNRTNAAAWMMFSLVLVAAGCASDPTFGDKISSHGQATKELGTNWNRGESMVKKGLKLGEEAGRLATKSKDKQAESENLLTDGRKLMEESEIAYKDQFGTSVR